MKIPKLGIDKICKFEMELSLLCDRHGLELEQTGSLALSRLIGKNASNELWVRYGFILREK